MLEKLRMYLLAGVSGLYFGIPVNLVKNVFEVSHLEFIDETYYLDGQKASIIDSQVFFQIKGKRTKTIKSGIKLNLANRENVIMLVDEILGFAGGKNEKKLRKPGFMNNYGFGLTGFFLKTEQKLFCVLDEKLFLNRIEEATWEN